MHQLADRPRRLRPPFVVALGSSVGVAVAVLLAAGGGSPSRAAKAVPGPARPPDLLVPASDLRTLDLGAFTTSIPRRWTVVTRRGPRSTEFDVASGPSTTPGLVSVADSGVALTITRVSAAELDSPRAPKALRGLAFAAGGTLLQRFFGGPRAPARVLRVDPPTSPGLGGSATTGAVDVLYTVGGVRRMQRVIAARDGATIALISADYPVDVAAAGARAYAYVVGGLRWRPRRVGAVTSLPVVAGSVSRVGRTPWPAGWWDASGEVTTSVNFDRRPGTLEFRRWRLRRACDSRGCRVLLTRTTLAGPDTTTLVAHHGYWTAAFPPLRSSCVTYPPHAPPAPHTSELLDRYTLRWSLGHRQLDAQETSQPAPGPCANGYVDLHWTASPAGANVTQPAPTGGGRPGSIELPAIGGAA
jgi:hypothetical protein